MSGSDYPKRALSSDDYRTDTWVQGMFENWFDPCPFGMREEGLFDGLLLNWPHRTFVNPPYSNPKPWVQKAIEVNAQEGHTIALLLKHDSSTQWYRLLHQAGAHFLLVNGRLKHQTGTGAAFPSVIVILEGYHQC